jgi:hypothetical protein
MTQVIQHDKNPSAEGAAARVSRASATPSLSTDAFTGWPQDGTRSHKIVATATTVATTGLPNADRPAAVAGETWSAAATVRNGAAGSRQITLAIVFYNTAGATLGTALATVSASAVLAAGETRVLKIDGAIAPALTASVDLQISRAAGTGAAISDAVHADLHTLTKTVTAVDYLSPTNTPLATWSGVAHASTQVYWTPTLSLTALTDDSPAPRIQVLIDDLPPGVATITLYRQAEGRTFRVRGAVAVPVAGAFQTLDLEAPFGTTASYRAAMFTSLGAEAGFTASAVAQLDVDTCWVHNPLDPANAAQIDIDDKSGRSLTRPVSGEVFRPEQRPLAVLITSRRRGLEQVELYFSTDDPIVAEKFESMFGGYNDDEQLVPVLCVRAPGFIDIPRPLFAGALEPRRIPVNIHMGGNLREWQVTADEAEPPFPGIVVALLSRDDIDAFFASRSALDAAYASRTAIDRDYSKAGIA